MFQKKVSFSSLLLVSISLVPLYGVFFLGWNPLQIFTVYCLETVLAGITNVIKMLLSTIFFREKPGGSRKRIRYYMISLFIICFFIIHYGFFIFVQTKIFFAVANFAGPVIPVTDYSDIPAALGSNGKLLLIIFAVYYFLDMIISFILPGKFRATAVIGLMFQPYARIFVQQLIVIGGSVFLVLGMTKIFMLIFVAVKLYVDTRLTPQINTAMNKAVTESLSATGE